MREIKTISIKCETKDTLQENETKQKPSLRKILLKGVKSVKKRGEKHKGNKNG